MKTSISVPDDVFESAEELAEKLAVSRSWLYSTAVAEYVGRSHYDEVTEKLNEVYAHEDSSLDPAFRAAQAEVVDEWTTSDGKCRRLTCAFEKDWYSDMKTTVSLPNDVFASAEELAEKLAMTRSALYATAVAEFVAKHQYDDLTQQYDEVYSKESNRLHPDVRRAQRRSVTKDEW